MSPPPKISFVLPTYNYGRYLGACVGSILAQDYAGLEVVIVDDASTDETPDIAGSLCRSDSRVSYFRHPRNVGPVANWNACLERATGDFVWLISADDALASTDAASRYLEIFREHPSVGFVFSRVQIIDENGDPQPQWIPRRDAHFPSDAHARLYPGHALFPELVRANFVPVMGVMARRVCYEQTGGFVGDLVHCGDWYNWLRFSLHWDAFYQPEVMAFYRQHTTNLSRSYADQRYPVENTLLCYSHLRDYIRQQRLPEKMIKAVDHAELLFKREKKLPRSLGERMTYRLLKLSGRL